MNRTQYIKCTSINSIELIECILEKYQALNYTAGNPTMTRLEKINAYRWFNLYFPNFSPYNSYRSLVARDRYGVGDSGELYYPCNHGPHTESEQFMIEQRVWIANYISQSQQDRIIEDMERVAENIISVSKTKPYSDDAATFPPFFIDAIRTIPPFFIDAVRALSYIEQRKKMNIAWIYARQNICDEFPQFAYMPANDIRAMSNAIIREIASVTSPSVASPSIWQRLSDLLPLSLSLSRSFF